ncbi:MAG: response regulator [Thermodesulfovibrionia bacterium]
MGMRSDNLMENGKVLIVDDDLSTRESLRMVLKDIYALALASDAEEGLNLIQKEPFDIVILDIRMPKMDGISALKEIKRVSPDTEVVLLTAYASVDTARDAVRYGAFDYLMKPFDKDELLNIIKKGLQKRSMLQSSRKEREHLRLKARILEEQIAKVKSNIIASFEGTINALLLAIDAKDSYTNAHSRRVSDLSCLIAKALSLEPSAIDGLKYAALIHDIGKIGIDETILRKQGSLTIDEYEVMQEHPKIGARIVSSVPFLQDAVPVILYHHERFNGTGYPKGIKGEKIPLTARIVAIADAIDAMLRARPYRTDLPQELIIKELKDNAGTQFDPLIVKTILNGKIRLV